VSATPTAEQLVHEEAVRAIGRQQAVASDLRQAASLLIATAAITIALLGGETARGGLASSCSWLAVSGFLVVAFSALAVIWLRHDIPTAARSVSTMTSWLEPHAPPPLAVVRHHLITQLADQQRLLAGRNAVLSRAFRIGGCGLIVQLAATVATRFLTTYGDRMWKRREDPLIAEAERRLDAMGTWYTDYGEIWRPGRRTWREYFRWFFFG
jgi:hypothetical protein